MVVGGRELIDTLWNVNLIIPTAVCTIPSELIDTLWNVNSHIIFKLVCSAVELIDTLWNVNFAPNLPNLAT